jgi:Ca2+/Na+ antiporter
MDWSFLDIFKKADFNTLMFSIALTGWILFYIYPENVYMLMAAILCSIYSVARFVVFSFKSYKRKRIIKANRIHAEQQERKRIQEKRQQAQYVYDRLSKESKDVFSYILQTATKSIYSNVYMLHDMNSCFEIIAKLRIILHRDSMIGAWVSIDEECEKICVYIESPLNEIIESNNK